MLTYVYDDAGRRTQVAAVVDGTDAFVTDYTYDDEDRVVRIEQHGVSGGNPVAEKRVDFAYDDSGRTATITRYSDLAGTQLVAQSDWTYDADGRLTGLVHSQDSTTLAGYAWTYDANGRITSATTPDGTVDYNYDATGQLVSADHETQADEEYDWDANGNPEGTGIVLGPNNRVLSDGTYSYQYDAEGNRTVRTTLATDEVVLYFWDHRNRLTAIDFRTDEGVLTKRVEYVYDALNRRILQRVDEDGDWDFETATGFVYDVTGKTDGVTSEALDDIVLVFDATGSLTNRYLHGPAVDQILADERSATEVYWTLTDHQGTVRDVALRDAATGDTTIVVHRTYDAFGQILAEVDPATGLAPTLGLHVLYAYTGREWDAAGEIHHYRRRPYDAILGQLLSEDPLGFAAGDPNLRRYVGNDVPNATDPSGLVTTDEDVLRHLELLDSDDFATRQDAAKSLREKILVDVDSLRQLDRLLSVGRHGAEVHKRCEIEVVRSLDKIKTAIDLLLPIHNGDVRSSLRVNTGKLPIAREAGREQLANLTRSYAISGFKSPKIGAAVYDGLNALPVLDAEPQEAERLLNRRIDSIFTTYLPAGTGRAIARHIEGELESFFAKLQTPPIPVGGQADYRLVIDQKSRTVVLTTRFTKLTAVPNNRDGLTFGAVLETTTQSWSFE